MLSDKERKRDSEGKEGKGRETYPLTFMKGEVLPPDPQDAGRTNCEPELWAMMGHLEIPI